MSATLEDSSLGLKTISFPAVYHSQIISLNISFSSGDANDFLSNRYVFGETVNYETSWRTHDPIIECKFLFQLQLFL